MRTLFIIPLVLMSLVSFPNSSVLAKEYVMRCFDYRTKDTSVYKLVDTVINRKLFRRGMGDWIESCTGKHSTFEHKGDGAVCKTIVQDEKDRCEGTGTYKLCTIDQIHVYDFYMYTHSITLFENGIPKRNDLSCKKVE